MANQTIRIRKYDKFSWTLEKVDKMGEWGRHGYYSSLHSLLRKLVDLHLADPDMSFGSAKELLSKLELVEEDLHQTIRDLSVDPKASENHG